MLDDFGYSCMFGWTHGGRGRYIAILNGCLSSLFTLVGSNLWSLRIVWLWMIEREPRHMTSGLSGAAAMGCCQPACLVGYENSVLHVRKWGIHLALDLPYVVCCGGVLIGPAGSRRGCIEAEWEGSTCNDSAKEVLPPIHMWESSVAFGEWDNPMISDISFWRSTACRLPWGAFLISWCYRVLLHLLPTGQCCSELCFEETGSALIVALNRFLPSAW